MSYTKLPAEVAARLGAALPVVARNAAQGAADRRIPDESLAALAEAGMFRLMVPKRYGGYEGNMAALLDAGAVVAEADGAAGWVVGLSQVSAWVVGLLSGKAQDDVFGSDPDAVVCGSINPVGTGEKVDGGFRLSGRWGYVSGSLHSQWAVLGFAAPPEDGQGGPGLYVALAPMAELTLHDTWQTSGMRGTGSNTLTCEDLFVPDYRVMSHFAAAQGQYPTEFKEATYRLSWFPTLTLVLVGPLLGIGQAAFEYVRSEAGRKAITATQFQRQADSAGFQIQLAEAALRIDSARLHAFRAADQMDRLAALQALPDYNTRARIRADASLVARYVTGAVSTLVDAHGSSGFAESSPLQRMRRDADVGASHALLNHSVSLEIHGKALLGVENNVSPAV
jgi:3-hydroxy-9,10-secoandrosta-1,3,5(10)-triene-9,17-dione monooxygenase